MGNATVQYNTLDLQTLLSKKSKIVSSEEALQDIVPVQWDDEVLNSQEKITVREGTRD